MAASGWAGAGVSSIAASWAPIAYHAIARRCAYRPTVALDRDEPDSAQICCIAPLSCDAGTGILVRMSWSAKPPIDVTIPGSPADPRVEAPAPDGIVLHRVPELHPDDVVTLPSGLRVTSVSRTLVDLAEVMGRDELRETFETARQRGLLDMAEVRASRARVEWRPSLAMLDELIAEFSARGGGAPR